MKNKKPLIAIISICAVAVIGLTFAFNSDSSIFNNLFGVDTYSTEVTEEFVSPDNWQPCQEVEKTIVATNTGNQDVAARIKLEEYWKRAGSTSTDHETELPYEVGGIRIAEVILTTGWENNWEKIGDWYYYKTPLQSGDSTTSLTAKVKMNCQVNLAGEMVYTDGGKTATTDDSDYDSAKYHLFATVQTVQADGTSIWDADKPHIADCTNPTELYDIIACQTNGVDSSIDFTAAATAAGGNGNGVNTLAAHAQDNYPVYYYRGEVDNNVIWDGKCWKAIRTTSTGGVKLIYSGVANNGQCTASGSDVLISVNNGSQFAFNTDNPYSLGNLAYSYTSKPEIIQESWNNIKYDDNTGTRLPIIVSTSASYDSNSGEYHLDTSAGNSATLTSSGYVDVPAGFHYICLSADSSVAIDGGGDTCTRAMYLSTISRYTATGLVLTGGDLFEDTLPLIKNGNNKSIARDKVETWFSSELASSQDDLEDTTFCADFTMSNGMAADGDVNNNTQFSYERTVYPRSGVPTVDCGAAGVNYSRGNGLSYSVGLITADEIWMAGLVSYQSGSYLDAGSVNYWSISPGYLSDSGQSYMIRAGEYGITADWAGNTSVGLRPVVSLKPATTISGGNGSTTTPYVVN